jgi:hypothetical protein
MRKGWLVVVAALAAGCGGGDGDPAGGQPNGATTDTSPEHWYRVANFDSALGAIDVCLQDASGTGQVSRYFPVSAANVATRPKARLVAGGAATCASAHPMLATDEAIVPSTAPAGFHGTAVLALDSGGSHRWSGAHTDFHQPSSPRPGPMRILPFARSLALVDLVLEVGGVFIPLRGAVGFGAAASGFTMNAVEIGNSWISYDHAPLSGANLGIRVNSATPSAPTVTKRGVDLVVGKNWSLFLVGDTVGTDALQLRACEDYVREGNLTRCF